MFEVPNERKTFRKDTPMSQQSIHETIKRIVAAGPFGALSDFDDKSKAKLDRVTGRQLYGQSATLFLEGAKPAIVNIQTFNSTPSGATEGEHLGCGFDEVEGSGF